jgi:copper transporter 1
VSWCFLSDICVGVVIRRLLALRAFVVIKCLIWRTHFIYRAQALILKKRNAANADTQSKKKSISVRQSMRSGPPFIPAHDIARGILHMGQAALGFAFMLAVMYVLLCKLVDTVVITNNLRRTFQAAFIFAIVVGLGVGEMLFGRFTNAAAHLP